MEQETGIEEARKTLGDLVNHAEYLGQVTYLTRHNRRAAAIVPLDIAERKSRMYLYLISAAPGDLVPGIDLALAGPFAALDSPAVQEWMAAQGFGEDTPDELMYVSDEPGPAGFESLRITVSEAEFAAWKDHHADTD